VSRLSAGALVAATRSPESLRTGSVPVFVERSLFTVRDVAAVSQPPVGVGSPVRLPDGRSGLVVASAPPGSSGELWWLVKWAPGRFETVSDSTCSLS
jgi:hypothetical protein